MKSLLFFLYALILFVLIDEPNYSIVIFISSLLIFHIIFESNKTFVFREWTLLLYAINYLIAPMITYNISQDKIRYAMKINANDYFALALPGFIFFAIGLYILPTKLFTPNFRQLNKVSFLNEKLLLRATLVGLFLKISSQITSGEFGFILYVLSMIRFIGAFSLFSLNPRKYFLITIIVIIMELFIGFYTGLYHDALMWLIFFSFFLVYVLKPSFKLKLIGISSLIGLILFIQAIKHVYRERVWHGDSEASIETISEIGLENSSYDILFGEDNLLGTLNRGNQAWIFASTVDNMDMTQDFQGLNNVYLYLESAILPRVIAPNKIKSGDKEIFNKFSGHSLADGTAMGLGVFADGYIAFGAIGVYLFGFFLGLIFSLTFKLVERWTNISPFYVLLILPILNYAVRPDCELQTTINHITKSTFIFGTLVYLTKKRFTLDSAESKRKLVHLNLMFPSTK